MHVLYNTYKKINCRISHQYSGVKFNISEVVDKLTFIHFQGMREVKLKLCLFSLMFILSTKISMSELICRMLALKACCQVNGKAEVGGAV